MPDTPRTLAALQTLLASGFPGAISAQDIRDALVSVYPHDFDIENHGAKPDGVTDSGPAINSALLAATASGGIAFAGPGDFVTNEPLVFNNGTQLVGSGRYDLASGQKGTRIKAGPAWSGGAMITDQGSGTTERNMAVRHLTLQGRSTVTNGILWDNDEFCIIEDLFLDTFQGAAVYLKSTSGNVGVLISVHAQNCVKATGLVSRIGAVHVEWSDCHFFQVEATTSSSDYSESGKRIGIFLDGGTSGGNHSVHSCIGELSEDGIVVNCSRNRLVGCRADLNRGHGIVLLQGGNQLGQCLALRNGQQADNSYDGFSVQATNNLVVGCLSDSSGVSNRHRYGFASTATADGNRFSACVSLNHGTKFYGNTADPSIHEWSVPGGSRLTALVDDTTPSVANVETLNTPSNSVPTAITQLDDGVAGQTLTIRVTGATNASTITDGGNFILNGNWSPSAANQTITLRTHNGTTWVELGRSLN